MKILLAVVLPWLILCCSGSDTVMTDSDNIEMISGDAEVFLETGEADASYELADGSETEELFNPVECLKDFSCGRIAVVAHRGYHKDYQENSLKAARIAFELGADLVEVDARHTKDEVIVLMHDSTIDRTTEGKGNVEDFTYADLAKINLKKCNPADEESCRIPTLLEVFEVARSFNKAIYVDLKTDKYELVADIIIKNGLFDFCVVYAGMDKLKGLKKIDPRINVLPFVDSPTLVDSVILEIPDVFIMEIDSGRFEKELVDYIHKKSIKAQQDLLGGPDMAAFLGDFSMWKTYITGGLNMVQTDYPDILVPLVKKYMETGYFPDNR